MSKLSIRLSGLWNEKDSEGNPFLRGSGPGYTYLVTENKGQKKPNEPDYHLLITAKESKPKGEKQ